MPLIPVAFVSLAFFEAVSEGGHDGVVLAKGVALVLVDQKLLVAVLERRVQHLAQVRGGVLPHGHLDAFDDGALPLLPCGRVLPCRRKLVPDGGDDGLPVVVGVVRPRLADRRVLELEPVDVTGDVGPGPLGIYGADHLQAAQDSL